VPTLVSFMARAQAWPWADGLADDRGVRAVVTCHGERPPHSVRTGLSTTPLMRSAHLCGERNVRTARPVQHLGRRLSRHSRTRGPRRGAPGDPALPRGGYRRATSGSGSSTFHPVGVLASSVLPGSVLTGTRRAGRASRNLRSIDRLTQPADPSRTASQQALATGGAGGPETSGASPMFIPDPR